MRQKRDDWVHIEIGRLLFLKSEEQERKEGGKINIRILSPNNESWTFSEEKELDQFLNYFLDRYFIPSHLQQVFLKFSKMAVTNLIKNFSKQNSPSTKKTNNLFWKKMRPLTRIEFPLPKFLLDKSNKMLKWPKKHSVTKITSY